MKDFKLSDRISRIQPSATLAMTAKAAELKRNNKPVYNMSVGEPDFSTPRHIQVAGEEAIRNGLTKYTSGSGTFELKEAISIKIERDNNLNYLKEQIIVSCGGKHSLYNACQTLFQYPDEVIIFSPYWVSFPDFVSVTGAKPIFVNTVKSKQFEPDFDDLEKKISNNTKGIIINSPSNPTGGVWSDHAVLRVLDLCKNKDIWIFSDECYEQLVYDRPFKSISFLGKQNDRILTFQSCSKTYAMTGWRIGYTIGNIDVIKGMSKLQGQSTSCPNSIAQHAAVAALKEDQKCVKEMKEIFLNRRDLILKLLGNIENIYTEIPRGAFYVFPDFSYYFGSLNPLTNTRINNSSDLSLYILNDTGVVTVAGDSFGAPNHIRLSYATSEETIIKAISLINKSLLKLIF